MVYWPQLVYAKRTRLKIKTRLKAVELVHYKDCNCRIPSSYSLTSKSHSCSTSFSNPQEEEGAVVALKEIKHLEEAVALNKKGEDLKKEEAPKKGVVALRKGAVALKTEADLKKAAAPRKGVVALRKRAVVPKKGADLKKEAVPKKKVAVHLEEEDSNNNNNNNNSSNSNSNNPNRYS